MRECWASQIPTVTRKPAPVPQQECSACRLVCVFSSVYSTVPGVIAEDNSGTDLTNSMA